MRTVAGIDSSTQSVKVEVRDLDTGHVVATGRGTHPTTTPPRSEQHPHAWWDALVDAFEALGSCRSDIAAVSVAGQQHGMVILDAAGDVIRPAKLWNDTESAPQADELVGRLGAAHWAQTCGSVPVAAFTVTKLAWVAQNEPENYARIASVLLPHDWLTYRLTGQRVTDRGDASGTGYYSAPENRWCTDLLEAVGPTLDWNSALPRVVQPFDVAGDVMTAAATALGLSAGIPVGAGTGDNMAAALGMGLTPGDVAISYGTSGTVYAVSDVPTADLTGCVAGFADASGHYLPLVCTLNATKVTAAVARLLGVGLDEFNALALAAPSGSGGLVTLPYFDGERTPNRPSATGVLSGIRSDVSREQLARASVEGVVCGLLDGVDALHDAGVPTSGRVLVLGGGARSAAYRNITAELIGRPVTIPDADEHVATGACVQAAAMLTGESVATIAARWGLGSGVTVDPAIGSARTEQSMSADQIRTAYAKVRG
jgi:xylulokinase